MEGAGRIRRNLEKKGTEMTTATKAREIAPTLWVVTLILVFLAPGVMLASSIALWPTTAAAAHGLGYATTSILFGSAAVLLVGLATVPFVRRSPRGRRAHALAFLAIEGLIVIVAVIVLVVTRVA